MIFLFFAQEEEATVTEGVVEKFRIEVGRNLKVVELVGMVDFQNGE